MRGCVCVYAGVDGVVLLLPLQMNWRNTPHGHAPNVSSSSAAWDEKHYNSPNTALMPDLAVPSTTWFDWIQHQGLRTHVLLQ